MPPLFVQEAETAWNTSPDTITTGAFDALQGDVLVAVCMVAFWASPADATISNSGTALTWTRQLDVGSGIGSPANSGGIQVWTTTLGEDRVAQTVSATRPGATDRIGISVLTFRSCAIGNATGKLKQANVPSMSFTTSADDSLVVVAVDDWFIVDGSSRVWYTAAGALTELTYSMAIDYTVYLGYHEIVPLAGTYTVGLSTPTTGTEAVLAAIELVSVPDPIAPEQTDLITYTAAQ